MTATRPILTTGLLSFVLALGLLLWLGPVWIYDLEDHIGAFLGALLGFLLVLALIAGGQAGDVVGVALDLGSGLASIAQAIVRRLARGCLPALLGVTAGCAGAFVVNWGLAHTPPLRLTYARARPHRALAADFLAVASVLAQHIRDDDRPPPDLPALVRALEASGTELRYSTLRDATWRDPWGQPFHYEVRRTVLGLGYAVTLYSYGPNGRDDKGQPDDIAFRDTLARWKALARRAVDLWHMLERLRRGKG